MFRRAVLGGRGGHVRQSHTVRQRWRVMKEQQAHAALFGSKA